MKILYDKVWDDENEPQSINEWLTPALDILPQWFKELPFDDGLMEETIVDQKIDNLLSVLNWDLKGATQTANTFDDLFSFE